MKLLRYGPAGEEKPGLLDREGRIRDLSSHVADIGPDALTFEVVGTPSEVEAVEELVRPYGVRELVRTGRVGLRRPSSPSRH